MLIGPLGTNFSEILIAIEAFSFKKMHLKMSSAKWRLNVFWLLCTGAEPFIKKQLRIEILLHQHNIQDIKEYLKEYLERHLVNWHVITVVR